MLSNRFHGGESPLRVTSIHENFKRDFAALISLTARIISSLYGRTLVSNYAIRKPAAKIPIQFVDEKERKPRALASYPNEHLAAGRFPATCQRWWSKLWCLVKSWLEFPWLARAREFPVSCLDLLYRTIANSFDVWHLLHLLLPWNRDFAFASLFSLFSLYDRLLIILTPSLCKSKL